MVAQGVKIGVMFDPSMFQLVTRVREDTLQHIQSPIYVAQARINAG